MIDPINAEFFKLAVGNNVKETENDIAVKCPICGDSKSKRHIRRLHLFHKNESDAIKCFNGGCVLETVHSVGKFLKDFYPELFDFYKKRTFKTKIKSLENTTISQSSVFGETEIPAQAEKSNLLKETGILQTRIQQPDYLQKLAYCIEPLNSQTQAFLLKRGLKPDKIQSTFGKFYSGRGEFLYNSKYYDLRNSLFIPIHFNSNLTGFYARNIFEKKFVNFGTAIPWNLNNIDNAKSVYIFEAILDALSFYELYGETNIIALCTSNINSQVLEFINHPIFCLDNDTTGLNTMLKYSSSTKNKFLIYPKELKFKDFNEMLLNNYKLDLKIENGFKANLELRKLCG